MDVWMYCHNMLTIQYALRQPENSGVNIKLAMVFRNSCNSKTYVAPL